MKISITRQDVAMSLVKRAKQAVVKGEPEVALHLLSALEAFTDGDEARMLKSMKAAFDATSDTQLEEAIVRTRKYYESAVAAATPAPTPTP